jgi:hypothetical protein
VNLGARGNVGHAATGQMDQSRQSERAPPQRPFICCASRALKERLGRRKVALSLQQEGEVVEALCRVGMPGAAHLLVDRQRALIKRPGGGEVALVVEQEGEVVEAQRPGDPSCASAPFYDPGRTDDPSPIDGLDDAAPALPTAKASVDEFRGSIARLQHPLPTLHE